MLVRPWAGPADTTAMQQLAVRLWPRGPHAGGVGWEAAIEQLPDETVLAEDGGGVAGWAGLSDGEVVLHADPASAEVARTLTEWAVDAAGCRDLTAAVFDGDETIRHAVAGAGFAPDADAEPVTGMFRSASPRRAVLPAGYKIRSVRHEELDARVQMHRAAWRPATLPWPVGSQPAISPEATSRFTAAHYGQVRRTWLYEQSRDLVVEAPDGTLAACCIAWWDPAAGCAEIEPLGVVPGHRGKGLAGAMCLEVAAQVAALGGEQVFINAGPRPDYPAPAGAYLKAGFEVRSRARIYRRSAAQ
jgi:GNAT superfamily N-acetyltransferase